MKLLRIVLGLICGVAATGPMSAVMILLHRRLPQTERYPLPPPEITSKAVAEAVLPMTLKPSTRSVLTWLAHFGYGGVAGGLYAQVTELAAGRGFFRGPTFGFIVWSISYLGLLPALRVLTPATEHPARRNAVMVVAHLVWGWVLANLYDVFLSDFYARNSAIGGAPRAHLDVEQGERENAHSVGGV